MLQKFKGTGNQLNFIWSNIFTWLKMCDRIFSLQEAYFFMTDELKERYKQIRMLQQNLASIRRIAGWTAEVLGSKIGVTKQTISNLGNQKSAMNFTQYIAIRSVIDAEIENNKENEVLPKVMVLLLDSEDQIDEYDYSKV
jgi:DNA-binding XRE family transcriptional regulator